MKRWIEIVVWIVFWVTSYFVLLGMFASSSKLLKVDFIYTAIFIVTLMAAAWANEYFRKHRRTYKTWAINSYGILMIGALFNELLFTHFIDYILPGYYFISYYSFWDLVKFFAAFVGLTTLLTLSIEWFQLQEERRSKIDAEFKALVNQVNPHFLFNGLTVLYTLSLKDNKETSIAILRLSDILRYVIYPSPDNTVNLSSEAKIIRDYIDLQRYRVHESTQIEFKDDVSNDASVSPMLFLPLVENAFKHGVHGETENAFVRIALREESGVVNFTISNNKSTVKNEKGIGLKNLKERLQLLYPQRHKFDVAETENTFNVHLQISL